MKLADHAYRLVVILNLTGLFVFGAPLLGVSVAGMSLLLLVTNVLYLGYRWPITSRVMKMPQVVAWIVFFLVWPLLTVAYVTEIDFRVIGLQLYYASLFLAAAVLVYVSGWEMFRTTVGVAIIVTAVGLWMSLVSPSAFEIVAGMIKSPTDYGGRAFGFLIQPNSSSASIVLMFIVWLAAARARVRGEVLIKIVLLLTMVGVTGSRGGFLTAVVVVAALLYDALQRRLRAGPRQYTRGVAILAGTVLVGIFCVLVVVGTSTFVESSSDSEVGSLANRLQFLARGDVRELIESDLSIGERLFALQQHGALIVQRPWTGYGLGAANRFLLGGEVFLPSHNVFVELAVNFGLFYIALLVVLLIGLLKNRHRSALEQSLRTNLFGQIVLAIVILGMADNTVFYSRTLIPLLGGLLGVMARQIPPSTWHALRPSLSLQRPGAVRQTN